MAGRWSERGILAVEMEAAVLFTLGALRKIQTGCMLIVSDVIVEGEFLRISDEDMRKAVDEMTEWPSTPSRPESPERDRLPRQSGRRERVDRAALAGDRPSGGRRGPRG